MVEPDSVSPDVIPAQFSHMEQRRGALSLAEALGSVWSSRVRA